MVRKLPEIFSIKSNSMYITKKCRFLESRRLSIKNNISLMIRTFLTIFILVISISIYGNIISVDIKLHTSISIASSITLLVLSFYDSSLNRQGRSEKFHKNGMDISLISTKYEIEIQKDEINKEKCEGIILLYEELIKSSDLNHSRTTYNIMKLIDEKKFFRSHMLSFFEYLISMITYIIPLFVISLLEIHIILKNT